MTDTMSSHTAEEHWTTTALDVTDDPHWQLDQPGYHATHEKAVESRLTITNGFLGVRGSLEQPAQKSLPRTYIAGIFEQPEGEFAVPVLVRGPDWLRLSLSVDGVPVTLENGKTVAHHRTLDMQRGAVLHTWQQRTPEGNTVHLRTLRFASLADRAITCQIAQIEVDHSGELTLDAWIEPPDHDLLTPLHSDDQQMIWRTVSGSYTLAVAASMALLLDGEEIEPSDSGWLRRNWRWNAQLGQRATLIKIVAFERGEAKQIDGAGALDALHRATQTRSTLVETHIRAWAERWNASDVVVEGDDDAQQALRFAGYHLNGVANPNDSSVSIGARALTGDAYHGHVFWDTETFLLPFYTMTWPEAARAMLEYRHHTLPGARAKAAELGYRGALYAWESTDTGEETTPPYLPSPDGNGLVPILCRTQEQHISADVAYAVWHYWQATLDESFMCDTGAEILLDTARFWGSRVQLEDDGRYHIREVIGPDEYHESVDDNAFTNVMARWNLLRGLDTAALLRERWPDRWEALRTPLEITNDELAHWRHVADNIYTGFDAESKLFEQFAGYFDLEPIDLAEYEPRSVPMDVILGREHTQQSQVIKQADVVMLQALLWNDLTPDVHEANFRYYEQRCGHGSSLSPAFHALVAARLGDVEGALRYFRQAAAIDLSDTMGNAAHGVHIATQGGLWQAAVFGFGGVSVESDGLRIEPHLPQAWRSLRFPLTWRGRQLRIEVRNDPATLLIDLAAGAPLPIYVGDQRHEVRAGTPLQRAWDTVS